MRTSTPSTRRSAALAVTVVLALTSLTGCGDDDSAAPSTPGDRVSPVACDAYVELGAAMMGDPTQLAPALEAFKANAPDRLSAEVDTVAAAYVAAIEDDDMSGLDSTEFTSASEAVGEAVFADCDAGERLRVRGVDYGFEGLPAQVSAGRVAIHFTNTSAVEAHEIVLFRRADGVEETIEELFELPEDELMAKIQPVGVAWSEHEGGSAVALLDLDEGNYIAICMIPVGGSDEGAPHAMHGMVAELTVT